MYAISCAFIFLKLKLESDYFGDKVFTKTFALASQPLRAASVSNPLFSTMTHPFMGLPVISKGTTPPLLIKTKVMFWFADPIVEPMSAKSPLQTKSAP